MWLLKEMTSQQAASEFSHVRTRLHKHRSTKSHPGQDIIYTTLIIMYHVLFREDFGVFFSHNRYLFTSLAKQSEPIKRTMMIIHYWNLVILYYPKQTDSWVFFPPYVLLFVSLTFSLPIYLSAMWLCSPELPAWTLCGSLECHGHLSTSQGVRWQVIFIAVGNWSTATSKFHRQNPVLFSAKWTQVPAGRGSAWGLDNHHRLQGSWQLLRVY